jgi:hypothetical protein
MFVTLHIITYICVPILILCLFYFKWQGERLLAMKIIVEECELKHDERIFIYMIRSDDERYLKMLIKPCRKNWFGFKFPKDSDFPSNNKGSKNEKD